MQIRELDVPDAFEVTPRQISDDRGVFLEWYRHDRLAELVGHALDLRQANTSVSRRGVVRGIHFADIPPGQAKYVTVAHGAVLDYVVDIRVGSPRFGQWDSVLLDSADRKAVYLPEGVGHAFVALTDDADVQVESYSSTHTVVTAGERQRVYDPSAGENEAWYVNDHTFVKGLDGKWHLFGITHEEPSAPLSEDFFAHATADSLTQAQYTKQPGVI